MIDWNVIDGVASATHFGDSIAKAPRSFYNSTSIGGGINFAAAQFANAPFEAERHTSDVSGDGTNNSGRYVQLARDPEVAKGVTVNGLVILTDIQESRQAASLSAHPPAPSRVASTQEDQSGNFHARSSIHRRRPRCPLNSCCGTWRRQEIALVGESCWQSPPFQPSPRPRN